MLNFLLSLTLWTYIPSALAYIPPSKMILQRTAENSGSGVYAIDQEVEFSNGADSLSVREIWLVENERTMRLTLVPPKDYADKLKIQYLYVGGQRWFLSAPKKRESQKISEDFVEKWFHFRNAENLKMAMIQNQMMTEDDSSAATKNANQAAKKIKPGEKVKVDDFPYVPESFLRLSRAQNVITYAFGMPTPAEDEKLLPGMWIEQDQFLIRKIRWPNQAEITADDHTPFSKGLHFPKTRILKWGPNTVTIKVQNIISKSGNMNSFFQPQSLDYTTNLDSLQSSPLKSLIEEFYSRFR